jgi:hypothetical protein
VGAVYFLTPDEAERKIVVRLICTSATGTTPKCGHVWDLEEDQQLYENEIKEF